MSVKVLDDVADFNLLRYLAAADAGVVYEKNLTYGSSWIKRGGVGAFMMLARKWDRLENQVEPYDYDIIDLLVDRDGSGVKDGPLDDIRDLRRYLLLVEEHYLRRYVQQQEEGQTSNPLSDSDDGCGADRNYVDQD